MKKVIFYVIITLFLVACSSVKNTQQAVNSGNYDKAIAVSVENLKKNKLKKSNQSYIVILEEAFTKASKRDLNKIKFLEKDNNPENIETVFNLYQDLKERQELIKPLLPLTIREQNRRARFKFKSYDSEIIASKNKLTTHLYTNVKQLLRSRNKFDYRAAYDDLAYLDKINPNFKDVRNLMNTAHQKGIDFVFVSMKNLTQKVIPKRLEQDLLNFDTYGLDDFWTVYHSRKDFNTNYSFGLELNLRNIDISPEQVREKQVIKEKLVRDGFKYQLDTKGNPILDEKGNKIKVDRFVNVRCELYQFTQFKSTRVVGQVKYIDLEKKQLIQTYPIKSEFAFQHVYANFKGDKRAIEQPYLDLIRLRVVPFPSNEQMIYDAGQDLKQRLKNIILRNKFRN